MAKRKQHKYSSFAEVLAAKERGELHGEHCLTMWTGTCQVTLSKVLRGPGPDDYDTEELYSEETADTFMLDVAKAMGWEGHIS